nr:thioredoxin family protein [Candidatus Sigynarchaeota archaeon]
MLKHSNDPVTIKQLIESHPAAIVDFSAEWCGPCKRLAKDLEKLNLKYDDEVVIIEVDKDVVAGRKNVEGQVTTQKFVEILPFYSEVAQLGGVPVIVFFKNGKKIEKILDEGEKNNGMIFGAIPGLKAPGNQFVSIEEIMESEKMIAGIKLVPAKASSFRHR